MLGSKIKIFTGTLLKLLSCKKLKTKKCIENEQEFNKLIKQV